MKKNSIKFTGELLTSKLTFHIGPFYEHLLRYLIAAQVVKNKIALDVGCGIGYGAFILSKHGKTKKAYGLDMTKGLFSLEEQFTQKTKLKRALINTVRNLLT